MNKIKLLNSIRSLAILLMTVSFLSIAFNYENSELVFFSLSIKLLGSALYAYISLYINMEIEDLNVLKSKEFYCLDIIRIKIEHGEVVDPELIKRSKDKSIEVTKKYNKLYGIERPLEFSTLK